jgi:hypothetical protein
MSFKTKIEDLIGSVGDDTLITTSIQDIGREIVQVLPIKDLLKISKTADVTSSGLTVRDKKILGVDKDDLVAREIPPTSKAKFKDDSSIYAGSDTDPVYYIEGAKIYIIGLSSNNETSGVLHYVPNVPTSDGSTAIVQSDSSAINFPEEAVSLIVLGASVRCLQRLMADKTSSLPTDISEPNLPVSPATPSAPSFTYSNASVNDMVQSLVAVSDMAALTQSAPVYNPPSITLENAPTISNLTITASTPVPPVLTTNSVTFNETAPVYSPPVATPSFTTVDTFISTDEDVELASAKIQEINAQIAEYQANIQNQLNVFNDANIEYQALFQKAFKNADLSQVDDSQAVQKYQAELQSYQAQIAKEVQEYQQNLEGDLRVWQMERQTDIQKYSAEIQDALNVFNKNNVVYQEDIQRKQQEFQKNIQVAIQNVQQEFNARKSNLDKDVQLNLQNAMNNFQKDVQEYRSTLDKYSAEVQDYQAEVASILQKFSSDVQNYNAKIQKQNIDYQWKQSQYNQLKAEYNQGLQLLMRGDMPQQQGG